MGKTFKTQHLAQHCENPNAISAHLLNTSRDGLHHLHGQTVSMFEYPFDEEIFPNIFISAISKKGYEEEPMQFVSVMPSISKEFSRDPLKNIICSSM